MALAATLGNSYDTPASAEVNPVNKMLKYLDEGLPAPERAVRLRLRFTNEAEVTPLEAHSAGMLLAAVRKAINSKDRQHPHSVTIGRDSSFLDPEVREKWTALSNNHLTITHEPHHFQTQFAVQDNFSARGTFFSKSAPGLKNPEANLASREATIVNTTEDGYLKVPLTEANNLIIKFESL